MADNMDLKKESGLEYIVEGEEETGIAMELLHEFKENNKRLDEQNKRIINNTRWLYSLVAFIVSAFLLYLYQYDFSGTIEQNGVYTLIDSSGNVISSDITPEQMEEILKIINGKDENNQNQN